MFRSHLDFALLQKIRKTTLATFNTGTNIFDFRKYYACGHVSLAVMKYIESGNVSDLKVKYEFIPLTLNRAFEHCRHEVSSRVIKIENSSLALITFRLLGLGSGSYAMVSAAYDTKKSTGRYMGGLLSKSWGDWFVLVAIGGKVYSVDAYNSLMLNESRFSDDYLSQYENAGASAVIYPVSRRKGMCFL